MESRVMEDVHEGYKIMVKRHDESNQKQADKELLNIWYAEIHDHHRLVREDICEED